MGWYRNVYLIECLTVDHSMCPVNYSEIEICRNEVHLVIVIDRSFLPNQNFTLYQ